MSDTTEAPIQEAPASEPNLMAQGEQANQEATSWMNSIDQEYMSSQSVNQAKSPNDLAKQVFNLEKVMGKPKVGLPEESWGEGEYNDFYNKLGRPETAGDYNLDGLPEAFSFTDEDKSSLLESLHKEGLTNKQANSVMKAIADREIALNDSVQSKFDESLESATNQLKEQWGDQFENKLKLASATLTNMAGDQEVAQRIQEKYGNDPDIITIFAKAGDKLLAEDSAFKGDMSSNAFTNPVAAQGEINQLMGDQEFVAAYTNKEHVGHKQAVSRMTALFAQANPQ